MTKRLLHRLHATYDHSFHIEMLLDQKRIKAYLDAIHQIVKTGDIVVDMGTGTGVLALLAAQSGAKRVYAIELDEQAVIHAQQNFLASPFADRITLIQSDATQTDLPEFVDVILGEMLHVWLVEEAQAPAVKNLRRFLKTGGCLIPSSIENFAALGSIEVLQPGCPILSPFHLWHTDEVMLVQLSETAYVSTVDLEHLLTLDMDNKVIFDICKPGRVNIVLLSSRAWLSTTQWVGTLPTLFPSVCYPLTEPIDVTPGDRISLRFRFQLGGRWNEIQVAFD